MNKPLPEWSVGLRDADLKQWADEVIRFCDAVGMDAAEVGEIAFTLVLAMRNEYLPSRRATLFKVAEKTHELTLRIAESCLSGDCGKIPA